MVKYSSVHNVLFCVTYFIIYCTISLNRIVPTAKIGNAKLSQTGWFFYMMVLFHRLLLTNVDRGNVSFVTLSKIWKLLRYLFIKKEFAPCLVFAAFFMRYMHFVWFITPCEFRLFDFILTFVIDVVINFTVWLCFCVFNRCSSRQRRDAGFISLFFTIQLVKSPVTIWCHHAAFSLPFLQQTVSHQRFRPLKRSWFCQYTLRHISLLSLFYLSA